MKERVEEIEAKVRSKDYSSTSSTSSSSTVVPKTLTSSFEELDSLHARSYVGMLNMLSGAVEPIDKNDGTMQQMMATQLSYTPPRSGATLSYSPSTPTVCVSPAAIDALSQNSNSILQASKLMRMELITAMRKVRQGASLSIKATMRYSSFKTIMIAFRKWEVFSASVARSMRMNKSPKFDAVANRRPRTQGRYASVGSSIRAVLNGEGTQGLLSPSATILPPENDSSEPDKASPLSGGSGRRSSRRSNASSRPTALAAARQRRLTQEAEDRQTEEEVKPLADKDEFWEVSSDEEA